MKKMGEIIARVFVDRRMNMYPLLNEIRETRKNVQNKSVTGSVNQDEPVEPYK